MGEHPPLDVVAKAYARHMARLVRDALSEVPRPLPSGGEDFDRIDAIDPNSAEITTVVETIDLDRAAIHTIVETIGGGDPAAWGEILVLLLSVCGDRFLEVCDGRL